VKSKTTNFLKLSAALLWAESLACMYGVAIKIMKSSQQPFFFGSIVFFMFIAVSGFSGGALLRAQNFELHSGDRLTFYGDSITAQRFYTRDIQDFVQTRYPTLRVTYHNAGVPGDKVTGGYAGDASERVERDVKPWAPTIITVMLGMNDGDYLPPDPKIFAEYQSGYEKLLAMLRSAAPDARITLIENTAYDEITHGTEFSGYMATTEQNAEATPALGRREGLPIVDDWPPVKEVLATAKATDPSLASLLVPDRIHPSEPLHWVMAESVMKAWHVDPVVSAVTLSASSQSVLQSERTQVTGVSGHANVLEWDQLDEALPLPFNFESSLMNFVLKISDLASVDQEMLRVNDLKPGGYELKIDKMIIGTFSAEQLGKGINLALLKTPMWQQAREYDGDLDQRSRLEDADLILSAGTDVKDRAVGSGVLREGEAEFEQKAQTSLRIAKHHYTLSAAN
jgi:lysophospholipase L1-like esterase